MVQNFRCNADLLFSHDQEELLQEEIGELDDAIACQVHVVDAVTQEIVGTASVQLWVMVEDSVNILRQVRRHPRRQLYMLYISG